MSQKRYKLRDLVIDRVDTVDAGANQGAHIALYKRHTEEQDPMADTKPTEDEQLATLAKSIEDATATAVAKAIEDTTAIFAAQYLDEQASFAKAIEDAAKEDLDITKRDDVPAEVRDAIAKERTERADLEKRLAVVETERINKAAVEFAKAHPFLSDDETDLGALYKSIRGTGNAELVSQFEALVAKAQTRLAQSEILKVKGTEGEPSTGEAKARQLAKARAEDKGVSYADALDQVLRENPDLYDTKSA